MSFVVGSENRKGGMHIEIGYEIRPRKVFCINSIKFYLMVLSV